MDIIKLKQLAHDLVIDGCHPEYLRGISELIAEVDGVEDVPHDIRSEQIAEEIYHSHINPPIWREESLEWWNKLTSGEKWFYLGKHAKHITMGMKRTVSSLTGREIEVIYKKEHHG